MFALWHLLGHGLGGPVVAAARTNLRVVDLRFPSPLLPIDLPTRLREPIDLPTRSREPHDYPN